MVGTYAAKLVDTSKALQSQSLDVLDSDAAYGCFWGAGARLAPADLQAILADDKLLMSLGVMIESSATTDVDNDTTVEPVARRDLFSGIYHTYADGSTTEDWSTETRTEFKTKLRTTVRSMLSTPGAKVWHVTYSPDWTDDVWMSADPSTGEVKVVVQGGDC